MDYKYIEQLLDRYWECETSLQEESILRSFFAQHDVPAHLKQYQQLFLDEETIANEHLSDNFDERIIRLVQEKEEHETKVVKAKTIRMGYRFQPFYKAAAMVAIVLSIGMAIQQAMGPQSESNVTELPPQVVPAAPETACDQLNAEQMKADSLAHLQDQQNSSAVSNTQN